MSREQILAKYNLDPEVWADESTPRIKKWIKFFKGDIV